TVEKKLNLGGTIFAHKALLAGEIDMYPEYTGTAYVNILHLANPTSSEQVFQSVKKIYQERFAVTWLAPFGFDNTNALIIKQEFAEQHHLTNISQLVPLANHLSIGVVGDFLSR